MEKRREKNGGVAAPTLARDRRLGRLPCRALECGFASRGSGVDPPAPRLYAELVPRAELHECESGRLA